MYKNPLTQCWLCSRSSICGIYIAGIVAVTESKGKQKRMVWLCQMTNSPQQCHMFLLGQITLSSHQTWVIPVGLTPGLLSRVSKASSLVVLSILYHLLMAQETLSASFGYCHGSQSGFFPLCMSSLSNLNREISDRFLRFETFLPHFRCQDLFKENLI